MSVFTTPASVPAGEVRDPGTPVVVLRPGWHIRLKHVAGIDRAIIYTVLARGCQAIGSAGTVLLIIHFLTPAEQGYYYTLWSLVWLQAVFELGFSFVILQLATHEGSHLTIDGNDQVTGDPIAHARLASVLQTAVPWYAAAAGLMATILLPAGSYFFSHHPHIGVEPAWRWPWALAVLGSVITFQLDPVFSFLEGCGRVAQVAGLRLSQAILSALLVWAAVITHHGLFSPALVIAGQAVLGMVFLYHRRRLLWPLMRRPVGAHRILWRSEVWPFQWRIAVSWLCSYFISQMFTPVLFAFRGPVVAGQMGLSLSIVTQLGWVVLAWMTTKAAPFGKLVARGEIGQLDRLFFRTLWQSLALLILLAISLFTGLVAAQHFFPALALRILRPPVFALLLLTALGSHIVQSEALYLRAHKCEPFLIQSVVLAMVSVASTILCARLWGAPAVVVGYFACMGVLGVTSATYIFQRKRRAWRGPSAPGLTP
ncbi:MAG: hypothetical protein ABSA80_20585 [Terriglobales bacterium]|jgi:hypothetical protein